MRACSLRATVYYTLNFILLLQLWNLVSVDNFYNELSRTFFRSASQVLTDFIPWFPLANGFCKVLAIYGLCCSPPLPILLPATTGQGLQISGQLTRREGKIYYNLKFENHTQTPLDKFMIQFNKNTFGLAAGGPLQVHLLIYALMMHAYHVGSLGWHKQFIPRQKLTSLFSHNVA